MPNIHELTKYFAFQLLEKTDVQVRFKNFDTYSQLKIGKQLKTSKK